MGPLTITALQIYCRVCRWKNLKIFQYLMKSWSCEISRLTFIYGRPGRAWDGSLWQWNFAYCLASYYSLLHGKNCCYLRQEVLWSGVFVRLFVLSFVRSFLISAPRLGVYNFCRWLCLSDCLSVCMYVCMYVVTDKLQIDSFFVSRRNRAIFGRHLSMWHSTKRCSSISDLGPLTPKIYSPKFAIAQNRL